MSCRGSSTTPWAKRTAGTPSPAHVASSCRTSHNRANALALLAADRLGLTCAESESLAAPLPRNSLRDLYWRMTRASMRLGSQLSSGIKLGFDTGFDSGSTLDYVYRNTPTGTSGVGRLIDRNYLDSIGWRGIRQRKLHVEELLRLAMQQLRDQGREVRIVDIAAGHGRYILEALQGVSPLPESILLRDYSDINVRDGSALIREKGLEGIARFVKGDAFDRADLAALEPKPTLAVVSGLYELFADNQMVSALPRRAGRSRGARWLSGLHRPTLAPAAGTDRPRLDQPPCRPGLGHAPAHPGGNGPAGGSRRLSQGRHARRRVGHFQRGTRATGVLMLRSATATREPGLLKPAVLWLLLLAPLFFGTYGFATWVTTQRDDVGSLVFGWEKPHAVLGLDHRPVLVHRLAVRACPCCCPTVARNSGATPCAC